MNTRIETVKQHLKDHKTTYIVGASCLFTGLAGGLVAANRSSLLSVRPMQVLTYKSTQNIEVFIEALGDPGNVIQDLTTGTIYASQGQAARELGLQASEISKHLNGKANYVQGHVFERLGKAVVPEA